MISSQRKVWANYSFPANHCSYRSLTTWPSYTPGCSAPNGEGKLRRKESGCKESEAKAGREREKNAAGWDESFTAEKCCAQLNKTLVFSVKKGQHGHRYIRLASVALLFTSVFVVWEPQHRQPQSQPTASGLKWPLLWKHSRDAHLLRDKSNISLNTAERL